MAISNGRIEYHENRIIPLVVPLLTLVVILPCKNVVVASEPTAATYMTASASQRRELWGGIVSTPDGEVRSTQEPGRSLQQTLQAAAASSGVPSLLTQCTAKASLLGTNFSTERCCQRGLETVRGKQPGTCSKPCFKGQVMASGSDTCTLCPIGTTSNGFTGSCMECPRGTSTAPADGIYECTLCPDGTLDLASYSADFNDITGVAYSASGRPQPCVACPPGFSSTAAWQVQQCSLCMEGFISQVDGDGIFGGGDYLPVLTLSRSICQPCGEGSYADTETNTCKACPPGTYSNNRIGIFTDYCTPCPVGTIATKPNSTACTPPCPCGFKWTDGCGQLAKTAAELKGVYMSYMRTRQKLPMGNAIMCVMQMVLEDPRHSSTLKELIESIDTPADGNSTVDEDSWQPDPSIKELATLMANIQSGSLPVIPSATLMDMDAINGVLNFMLGTKFQFTQMRDLRDDLMVAINNGFKAVEKDMEIGFNAIRNIAMDSFIQSQASLLESVTRDVAELESVCTGLDMKIDQLEREGDLMRAKAEQNKNEMDSKHDAYIQAAKVQVIMNVFQLTIDILSIFMRGNAILVGWRNQRPPRMKVSSKVPTPEELATKARQANAEKLKVLGKQRLGPVRAPALQRPNALQRFGKLIKQGFNLLTKNIKKRLSNTEQGTQRGSSVRGLNPKQLSLSELRNSIGAMDVSELTSVEEVDPDAIATVQDILKSAEEISATTISSKLDSDNVGLEIEVQLNFVCTQGGMWVQGACEEYRTALKKGNAIYQAQLAINGTIAETTAEWAKYKLQIFGKVQSLADYSSSIDTFRDARNESVDISNYDELFQSTLALAIQHNLTKATDELNTAINTTRYILAKCALMRFTYPSLYYDPLCKINPLNLRRQSISLAITDIQRQETIASKASSSEDAIVSSGYLPLVGVDGAVPGLPINISNFKATRLAAFTLDQKQVAHFLKDARGAWSRVAMSNSRIRMRSLRVLFRGATVSPDCEEGVTVGVSLSPPFKLRYLTDTVDNIYEYNFPAVDGQYSFLPKEMCSRSKPLFTLPGGTQMVCDVAPLTWAGTAMPSPFATWSISLEDNKCLDLAGLNEIFLTMSLVVDSEYEEPIDPPIFSQPDTNSSAPSAYELTWQDYSDSCTKANKTLCTVGEVCPGQAQQLQDIFKGPDGRLNATYIAVTNAAKASNLWVPIQNGTNFCVPVALGNNSPLLSTAIRGNVCC